MCLKTIKMAYLYTFFLKCLFSFQIRIDYILASLGFENSDKFVDSLFHTDSIKKTLFVSSTLAFVAHKFEGFFGFTPIVGFAIVLLFAVEVWTGIKASKKEGFEFESTKFNSGFVKLFIYAIMIGVANVLQDNIEVKTIFGFQLNYYEWIHYALLNFVLIQYIISNIENFERLGWAEYVPLLSKLKGIVNFKGLKKDE